MWSFNLSGLLKIVMVVCLVYFFIGKLFQIRDIRTEKNGTVDLDLKDLKVLYLDSLQWKDFKLDQTFVQKNCHYNLDVHLWAYGKTTKICLLPDHMDIHVSRTIKGDGNWERHLQKPLFEKMSRFYPNASFVDIGSHVGTFSLSAATMGYNVFAFEPTEISFQYLAQSVMLNEFQHLIRLYPVALLEKHYKCAIPQVNKTSSNLGGTVVDAREVCGNDTSSVATLDDLLPLFQKLGIREALMKIDCEGSEPKVISGGMKFLSTIEVPYISMEAFIMKKYLKDGTDVQGPFELMDTMKSLGYIPVRIGSEESLSTVKLLEWPNDFAWIKETINKDQNNEQNKTSTDAKLKD